MTEKKQNGKIPFTKSDDKKDSQPPTGFPKVIVVNEDKVIKHQDGGGTKTKKD